MASALTKSIFLVREADKKKKPKTINISHNIITNSYNNISVLLRERNGQGEE